MIDFIQINSNGKKVSLDMSLSLEERISFVQELLDKYPLSFQYTLPTNSRDSNGRYVEARLNILGSYILAAVPREKEDYLLSDYKENKIMEHEVSISVFEDSC